MKRRKGFTLVELLVVIGIIALLISMLLPALNKARQQASKIACAANLHNLGLLMAMYTDQNRGSFPMARGFYDAQGNEQTWGAQLSRILEYGNGSASSVVALDSTVAKGRGIFVCPDAISFSPIEPNDYAVHPLLMPNMSLTYPTGGPYVGGLAGAARRPYRVTRIRNSSDIVMIFDSVQSLVATPNTGVGAASADGFALDGQRIAVTTAPATYLQQPWSSSQGFDLGQSVDGGINKDSSDGSASTMVWGNIRWRHLGNKAANFLFVDGHVEGLSYTSRYNTGLARRNVCIPAPQ